MVRAQSEGTNADRPSRFGRPGSAVLITALSEVSHFVIWGVVALAAGLSAAGKTAYESIAGASPACAGPIAAGQNDNERSAPQQADACPPSPDVAPTR